MKNVTAIFMAAVLVLGTVAVAEETSLYSQYGYNKAKATVQSDNALPFMVDIEKTPGWMVYLEGGYQWNFFRGAGLEVKNAAGGTIFDQKKNHTKSGAAGAIALGYNFCPKFPLTVGLKVGAGPQNRLHMSETRDMEFGWSGKFESWQKIRLYTLDFALDYDFKSKSKLTPFVGLNFGLAMITQRASAKARIYDDGGDLQATARGDYGNRRKFNLMGGFRTGLKYDVNKRVALTFFGQYSYLGTIKGKGFTMTSNDAGYEAPLDAHTKKIKAHMVEAKLGIRIAF